MFGLNGLNNAVSGVNAIDDNKKKQEVAPQPQVAFMNSIWDNFGNSQGTEASFNA
mgnify:CR=1 FL=1